MVVIPRSITSMFDYVLACVVVPLNGLYLYLLTVTLLYLTVTLLYIALLDGYFYFTLLDKSTWPAKSKVKLNL
jgi:hypothetical protein